MKTKGKVILLTGILAALTCTYMWGIPAAVNLPQRKDNIEQQIYQKTGFALKLGNPQLTMGFFPSVWVKSDKIEVLNKDNSKALSVINPKVKLKLFPLLFKKIEVSHIYADKEDANFILTKNKEFYLGDYPLKLEKKDTKFSIEKINTTLGEYRINLDDRLNNKKVSLNGKYLNHGEYLKNDKLKLATEGVFTTDNKSTDYYIDFDINLPLNKLNENKLKLSAKIKDFDLSTISDYVAILSNDHYKKLGGIINFNSETQITKHKHKRVFSGLTTENLQIIGQDRPSSIIFPDKLFVKINFDTINGGVDFKNSTIKAKDIDFTVNGKLTSSGKKIPAMDITGEFKPSKLEQVVKIIPGLPDLLPDMNLYKLKEYYPHGVGEGKLHFVGHGERPEVFGNVKLRDIYVIKPIPNAPENARTDLTFKGKHMQLDIFVPVAPKTNVVINGFVKIDGSKYSELKIKSNDYIPMEPAQEVINPMHEIFKFKMGPVPIMKLKGLGTVDVFSAGKKVDPHLWGYFKFKNATASFNDIHNLELNNGSGEIHFQNTKIPFRTYTATINGQSTKIYGDCDVKGGLNVFAQTSNQKIPNIVKVINTSEDMKDVQKVLKPFTHPDGTADLLLNIYGVAKDIDKIEFNKDLFAKGTVTLHNATTILKDTYLPLKDINGIVNFDKKNADYDLTGYIRDSKIYVKGTATEPNMDLTAWSDNIAINDIIDMTHQEYTMPYKDEIGKIHVSFKGGYKGIADSDNLDYNKIVADGKVHSNYDTQNPIKVSSGTFNIHNGILQANGLKGLFNNNPFTLSFTGKDIYNNMKIADAKFNMDNFDLTSISDAKDQIPVPESVKNILENITDVKGNINISGYMKNGGVWTDMDLSDTSFTYKPTEAYINIVSGKANMRGDTLYLGKINSRLSSMPLFIDGNISNIFKDPNANLYIAGKPTQMFFDRFFNNHSLYPIKVKGDVNFSTQVKGTLDRLFTHSELNIKENSSIYYMGATLSGAPSGEATQEETATNPVSIIADMYLMPNKISIKSLKYNQTLKSQNNKEFVQNQLTASGDVSIRNNNILAFNNLKLKTSEPTDAKIFNIILKKPTIKQGIFTSDLTINGTSTAPRILGDLNISSIDIPVFDSTIRDINLDFQKDYINLVSRGTILTNEVNLLAKIVNNPNPPIIIDDLKLQLDVLDLNTVINRFNDFDMDKLRGKQSASAANQAITPDQIILKNGEINADKILIKKASATNFTSSMHLGKDQVFSIDNFKFNLANGEVEGKLSSDLNNFGLDGQMSIKGADAQIISENFFDMPGQMYGLVTGDMQMSCKGSNSMECINTLNGEGHFDVIDGRMPKLGSLEYLLKATNLITGGITGLSINGIIDLITPLKSGNFDNIKGDIKVSNGVANDINIYSSGKELNMYLTGSYNISSMIADMEVYGSLSKNFSTVLGFIGNMSLNRLFNKIPGININEINPKSTSNIYKIPNFDKNTVLRVFKAEIFGDINGTNYVKSFRWIKH